MYLPLEALYFKRFFPSFRRESDEFYPCVFWIVNALDKGFWNQAVYELGNAALCHVQFFRHSRYGKVSFTVEQHQALQFGVGQAEFLRFKQLSVLTALNHFCDKILKSEGLIFEKVKIDFGDFNVHSVNNIVP